jgi:hypothetical protein
MENKRPYLTLSLKLLLCWIACAVAAFAQAAALTLVADVPLPGPAVRFDYQSYDREHGPLHRAHER